jgi:membrane fusion protein (multidrug efflux system)
MPSRFVPKPGPEPTRRGQTHTRRAVLTSFSFGLAALALGCNGAAGADGWQKAGGKGPGGPGGGRGGPPEPLAVELTTLEPATIERHYRASGTLEPLRQAELRPIRAGIINVLEVEVGDVVTDGQVLARLDGRELSLAAHRDSLSADNAAAELDRLNGLDASGAVASQEIDLRRHELEAAKAAARLSKAQASTMLVRAPFAGTVITRPVDIGNLAGTSTVIYEVADLSALELPLHLPEREAAAVTVGSTVEIELVNQTTFSGEIVRRAPVVDALTGTVEFLVRATKFPPLAVPGAFVRARVLLERREGVASVPADAVFELEGARYVYVLREGKARRVAIELGLEGPERVEIRSGLVPEDRVLTDANGITEGMPIKPTGEPDIEREPEPAVETQDANKRSGGWGGNQRRR